MSANEIEHFRSGKPWEGFTLASNWVVIFLVPIWLTAAFALFLKKRGDRSLVAVLAGIAAAVVHFAVLRLGENVGAYVYLAGAVIAAALVADHGRLLTRERKPIATPEPAPTELRPRRAA